MWKTCTWTPSATSPASRNSRRDRSEVDRRRRPVDRPGVEERRDQVVAVVLTAEAQRVVALERAPDVAQRRDQLAEARRRRLPRNREAPHVVRAHLRPQSEHKASAARPLQIPGGHRGHHRAACERGRIAVPRTTCSVDRRCGERQERIVLRLGRPDAVVAGGSTAPPRALPRRRIARDRRVDLHGDDSTASWRCAARRRPRPARSGAPRRRAGLRESRGSRGSDTDPRGGTGTAE